MDQQKLMKAIMAIQNDTSLTDVEKAKKRQELMSGKFVEPSSKSCCQKHAGTDEVATSPGGTRRSSRRASMSGAEASQSKDEAGCGAKKAAAVPYAQATLEEEEDDDILESLKCSICFELCRQPISLPCQHNMYVPGD
jgi:hypothetical protein